MAQHQPGWFSRYSDDLRVVGPGFSFRHGQEIFLYSIASRPDLGPNQPPIQWVPGALSLEVKRSRREDDQSPPSSADVKNGGVIRLISDTSAWRGA
jgi:hypothetical protein